MVGCFVLAIEIFSSEIRQLDRQGMLVSSMPNRHLARSIPREPNKNTTAEIV